MKDLTMLGRIAQVYNLVISYVLQGKRDPQRVLDALQQIIDIKADPRMLSTEALVKAAILNDVNGRGNALFLTISADGTFWAHLGDDVGSVSCAGTTDGFPSKLAHGNSPEEAINLLFEEATNLKPTQVYSIKTTFGRRQVRWSGRAWEEAECISSNDCYHLRGRRD